MKFFKKFGDDLKIKLDWIKAYLFKEPLSGVFYILGLFCLLVAFIYFVLKLINFISLNSILENYLIDAVPFLIASTLFFYISEARRLRLETQENNRFLYLPRLIFYSENDKVLLKNVGKGCALNVQIKIDNESKDFSKTFFNPEEEWLAPIPKESKIIRVSFHSPIEQEYKHIFYTEQETTNFKIIKRSWGGNYKKNFKT